MFLTGDTAQSITRGISFRFSDLKSLFFHARRSMRAMGKTGAVEVPKQVYQLIHNYRSHPGILSLSSSIFDLLVEFFPESLDRLKHDQGLFNGLKPMLLESCSISDLAVLLRGNRRKTSHIDFGIHQAILVVDEAARESMPEELRHGLILTISEAKRLEFDNVLLYNFFKNSQGTCDSLDLEKRAPMFEYFKAQKLVKCLTVHELSEASKFGIHLQAAFPTEI
ncbi:hypothetical protein CHS0354_019579 [Potamilus streckersoni]|uniref:Uncharacterized protein n=1 Tax=Potamilus streckersoni TaxID=2493646 RepID=A0AAE0TG20_9BIVA|nr:hypothetical protein CHS0354_019579 [Potamilus streckersoni]